MKLIKIIFIYLLLCSCDNLKSDKSIKADYSELLSTQDRAYELHFIIANLVKEKNLSSMELKNLSTRENINLYISVNSAYFNKTKDLSNGEGEEWRVIAVINSNKDNNYLWVIWPNVTLLSE